MKNAFLLGRGLFMLAGALLLAVPARSQDNSITTTLSTAPPQQEAVVSNLGDEPNGWQWRWTNDTGRRDVGQTFTAPSDFTLDKVAFAIRSGSAAQVSRSAFTLTLARYANAQAVTAEEKLASWHGTLPDNEMGAAYQQGRWLMLDVPNFKLKAGQIYGVTLQFDAAKPTGQGVVFSMAPKDTYAGGRGLFSVDGQNWQASFDFNFQLIAENAAPLTALPARATRVLEVDRGGGAEFKTLASAARAAQPGDTIRLKPDSGPYREILYVPTSGTAQAPIIIEGNNNLVTGFEPLTNWTTQNGVTSCRLPTFPCVLCYKNERLIQDFAIKQFTKYATINEAHDTLTLLTGVSTEGWEISIRPFAVQITDTSYQTFRNLRASGSTNDGFNLHGTGAGLVFENIEAFHNLDEGYSAHDNIVSEIRGAKFWGNDNGLANVGQSQTKLSEVDIWENLGFGFWLNDCQAEAKNVRSWKNGAEQVTFRSATIVLDNVQAFTPTSTTRPWVSYKESATASSANSYSQNKSQLTGTVTIHPQTAPTG